MFRVLAAVILVSASSGPCLAGLPFSCQASGDSWSVVGKAERKVTCNFTCALHDPRGNQDNVSCTATIVENQPNSTICEGYIVGKHWGSATLVTGQCATVAPP